MVQCTVCAISERRGNLSSNHNWINRTSEVFYNSLGFIGPEGLQKAADKFEPTSAPRVCTPAARPGLVWWSQLPGRAVTVRFHNKLQTYLRLYNLDFVATSSEWDTQLSNAGLLIYLTVRSASSLQSVAWKMYGSGKCEHHRIVLWRTKFKLTLCLILKDHVNSPIVVKTPPRDQDLIAWRDSGHIPSVQWSAWPSHAMVVFMSVSSVSLSSSDYVNLCEHNRDQ